MTKVRVTSPLFRVIAWLLVFSQSVSPLYADIKLFNEGHTLAVPSPFQRSLTAVPGEIKLPLQEIGSIPEISGSVGLSYSILGADIKNLRAEVEKVKLNGMDSLHVDHFDGKLTRGESVDSAPAIREIADMDVPIFVHLWVKSPDEDVIDRLISSGLKPGRDKVVLPYECCSTHAKLISLITYIKKKGLETGVSLNPETPITVLDNIRDHFDPSMRTITVMGVVPGAAGQQAFIPETIDKIRALRKMLQDKGINAEIEADGGMVLETCKEVITAGADSFCARTLFFKSPNLKERVRSLKEYGAGIRNIRANSDIIRILEGFSFSIVAAIDRNGKKTVRKQALYSGEEALRKEIKWLLKLPPELKRYFPEVLNYSLDRGNVHYEMTYYPRMKDMLKKISDGEMDAESAKDVIQAVLSSYLKDFIIRQGRTKASPGHLREKFVGKIENRIKETLKRAPHLEGLYGPEYLTINGKKYRNIPSILRQMKESPELLEQLNPRHFHFIHGDLSLQNIMAEGKEFLLVDPEGENSGDMVYDLSKLAQVMYGKMHLLDRGFYDLDVKSGEVKFSFKEDTPAWAFYSELEKNFDRVLNQSGVMDYLSEHEPYWRLRMQLMYSLNFAGYAFFRLDNEEKAKAFYIESVILINEFLDRFDKLSEFGKALIKSRAGKDAEGKTATLLSVCPMSEDIIRANVQAAREDSAVPVFIATPRQVDVEGSYTGWDQNIFVELVHRICREESYEGPVFIARDHGGPWQRPQDSKLSLAEAMANAKRTFEADIRAGFNILHIDVTADRERPGVKLTVEEMVERTVELISHCENFRAGEGRPPVTYEIGSDECAQALGSLQEIDSYVLSLRDRLNAEGLGYVWDNVAYLVVDTGAKISGAGQVGSLRGEDTVRACKIASRAGLSLKQHNTDFMTRDELKALPTAGVAAANIGPEISEAEYSALDELEKNLAGLDPKYTPVFMPEVRKMLGTTDRWKRWFPGVESIEGLPEEDQKKIIFNCGRYVQNFPSVIEARKELYRRAEQAGIKAPAEFVTGKIRSAIREMASLMVAPAGVSINMQRASRMVVESDTLVFDIDHTLNRERRAPVAEDAAFLIWKFLSAPGNKRKKVRIVTGRPLSKVKGNNTLGLILQKLKQHNVESDIVVYVSDGGARYTVTNDGVFKADEEYNRPFTTYESNRVLEVLNSMHERIEEEQNLTRLGIKKVIVKEGDSRFEWSPYGNEDPGQYSFETDRDIVYTNPRKTRAELAKEALELIRARGVEDIDAIVSGSTTIGFVRRGVNKRRAIIDILNEGGKITYMGDEVGTITDVKGFEKAGNDNVVGLLAQEGTENLNVVSLDEVPVNIPKGVTWIGERCDGTVKLLEKAYYDMMSDDEDMEEALELLGKYGITRDNVISISRFEKGHGIHARYFHVRTGKKSYILRHVSPKLFSGDLISAARYEVWLMNTLREEGIPAVPINRKKIREAWEEVNEDSFICADSEGKYHILYDFVEEDKFQGVHVGSIRTLSEKRFDNMMEVIAKAHAATAGKNCPYTRKYGKRDMLDIRLLAPELRKMRQYVKDKKNEKPLTRAERFIYENAGFIASQMEEVSARLAPSYHLKDLRRTYIHGDYNATNVIFREDDVLGVIDWEHSQQDIMVLDVVSMLRPDSPDARFTISIDNIKRTLFDYNRRNPLTEAEIRTLPELYRYRLLDRLARMVEWERYYEAVGFDFKGVPDHAKSALLMDKNDAVYNWHVTLVNSLRNFAAMVEDGSFEREIVEPLLRENGISGTRGFTAESPAKSSEAIIDECKEALKGRTIFSVPMRRKLGDISLRGMLKRARPADAVCRENPQVWKQKGNYYDNGWLSVMKDFEIIFAHKYAVIYRVPTGNVYIAVRGKNDARVKENKDKAVIEIVPDRGLGISKIAPVYPASEYDLSRSGIAIQLTDAEVFDRFPEIEEALRYQLVWQEVDGESRFREVMDERTVEMGSLVEKAVKSPLSLGEKEISGIMALRYVKSKVIRRKALQALAAVYGAGRISEDNFRKAAMELIEQDVNEDYRVIERAVKYKEDFVREIMRNLFKEDAGLEDISGMDIVYFDQDDEKEIFKVMFNLTGGRGIRVAAFSLIRHDPVNNSLPQEAIEMSTSTWKQLSRNGLDQTAKYGASYWELDYRARMVNYASSRETKKREEPLVNNIQVTAREFVEGETLEDILSDRAYSLRDRKKAVDACLKASEDLFTVSRTNLGKGYYIEDPDPGQFVVYREGSGYRAKIVDLDRLVEFPDIETVRKLFRMNMSGRIRLKTLFVNTAEINSPEVRPPLAIAYLSSAVKSRLGDIVSIEVEDLGLGKSEEEVEDRILLSGAEVFCISIPASSLFGAARDLADKIKSAKPGAIVIAGGIHPSLDPEGVMNSGEFDLIVKGEGENVLVEVLDAISSGRDISEVKGISYRDEKGRIRDTALASEMIELDGLTGDVFSELPMGEYDLAMDEFSGERFLPVMASRGCPFSCRFCSYSSKMSMKVRSKSPGKMADEIEAYTAKYGVRNFFFNDDTFTLDREFVKGFCDEVIKRGMNIRWRCFTRADKVDRELLALMGRAGCSYVAFGLESADPEVLSGVNKNCSLESYRNARIWAGEAGIRVKFFLMFGLPYQTERSVEDTIEFLRQTAPEEIDAQFFVPYPGSEFAADPDKWGIRILERDYAKYRQRPDRKGGGEVEPVVETQWMKRDEIVSSRQKVLEAFRAMREEKRPFYFPREGISEVLEENPDVSVVVINRDGKYFVRKRAFDGGEQKVRSEIEKVLSFPDEMPEAFAYSLEKGNVYYEMPYTPEAWLKFGSFVEGLSGRKTEKLSARADNRFTRDISELLKELRDPSSETSRELASIYGEEDLERQRERYISLLERFRELYPDTVTIALSRAGGRVVLSGDKIDYHHGSVLNSAMLKDVITVVGVNPDSKETIFNSMEPHLFPTESVFAEDFKIGKKAKKDIKWFEYSVAMIQQVSALLASKGAEVPGLRILTDGRAAYGGMPVSSGLSSSAASIVSLGVSVAGITGMRDKVSASEMTDACVATEQRLGFPCGKQDPWGSLMGWLDSGSKGGGFAEMMDCVPRVDGDGRSKINSFLAPMPEGYSALVFRVAGGAETAGGRYKTNIRVAEGEMGSYLMSISLRNLVRERYPEWSRELDDKSAMGRMYPDMAAADNEVFPPYYKPFYFSFINLRNMGIPLSKEELMELVDELPSEVTKAELREKYGLPADKLEKFTESCRGIGLDLEEIKFDIRGTMRHAVTEQERVEESARALKEKDLDAFFRLQRETHLSLVENYKITPELSMKLIDILDSIGYVRASRLHGPGNGVNVLAWVRSSDADKLAREVKETFYKKHEPFSRLPEGKIDEFIIPFHPGKGADLMFVKGREVGEDLSMPFTAAAICKYIEAEGNLDGSRGLLDVISKAKALEEVNVGILPGEVTIELPGASTVVRYFDPSRNNVITPYSDMSKLETSVISKNLTRQIIHRVIAIEREPGLTGKAAGVETNDGEMERIRYVDKSLDIFRAVLGGDKRNVLLRVPVEVLESIGPENAGSFLEKFQEASNSFVELYYMSGMGEAGSSVYGRYGITRKELPEDLIGPEKRSRANTVTLLAVNKGERVDQTTVISRLGNPSMSERNTVLSPVGILNDPAGLVMASILGLKIMEVARKTGSLDKDEIQRDVIEDLKMIYSPEDLKGLTPEDILRLALSDNINHIMRSLEKLIQLLPISPVDPGELKEIYERIRTVISAA